MDTRFSLFLLITVLGVSACQTTIATYDKSSFTSQPFSASYTNSDEFVRDSIAYLMPRKCVFWETSDGARSSENKKPNKFSFNSIIENRDRDGWYVGYLSVEGAFYGALGFYFNKDTGDYSCGGHRTYKTKTGFHFVAGRYLELGSLSSKPTQPSAQVDSPKGYITSSKTEEIYEKANLMDDVSLCSFAIDSSSNTNLR